MKFFFIIIFFPAFVLSQTIQLRGKVIDSYKQPVKNLTIRFTSFGEVVTTGSGEFIISVPKNVRSLDVTVNEENWHLLYPVDSKIPVPLDQTFIITLIVSETGASSENNFDNAVIKYNDLKNLLEELGSTRIELEAFLERFIELESEKLEMSEDIFRKEFERKEKTETAYSSISHTLNEYILRANNLATTFDLYYELSFRSAPAVENLNKAIGLYNPVYDSINNNVNNWTAIINLAKDSFLADDFSSSINHLINEIHKPYILQLNNAIKLSNEIRLGIESDDISIEEKKRSGKNKVISIINSLKIKIPLLQKKFDEILKKLFKEV